jgi:hypothetical protein
MDIDSYLNIINVHTIEEKNPRLSYALDILKNDKMIDSVCFKIQKEYKVINPENELVFELKCISDLITDLKFNIPVNIIIDNEETNTKEEDIHNLGLITNKNIKIKIDKEVKKEIFIVEYIGHVFSNIVHHELSYYKKKGILKV